MEKLTETACVDLVNTCSIRPNESLIWPYAMRTKWEILRDYKNEWPSAKNKVHKIKEHLLIIRIGDCEELEIVKYWKL